MDNRPLLYNQGSIKFKLCITNPYKSAQPSQNHKKTNKHITKARPYKCCKQCKRHKFQMTRIQNDGISSFCSFRFDVCHNYCYSQNFLLKKNEGGLPTFNNDGRFETPAFSLKAEQIINQNDIVYEQRFKDVLARATKESGHIDENWYGIKVVEDQWSSMIGELIECLKRKNKQQIAN